MNNTAIEETEQETKKEYYFLFGELICKRYHTYDFDKVLKFIKEDTECDVHKYIEGEHPENLMEAASGWGEYASITKEEYNQILAIKEEQEN